MAADYSLDIVGVIEGTDKCSAVTYCWDYLRKYQILFGHLRDTKFNLIEIGVLGGTSLKMWRSFFRQATIVGLDINPACVKYADDQIEIRVGSQDDPGLLARVCAEFPPTIVIDDGSHLAHHIIYTFERVYPSVLPGGYYAVEDLSFHFGDEASKWRRFEGPSPPDYFGALIRARMGRFVSPDAPNWGTQKYVFDNTDAITTIDSAVIFQKRAATPSITEAAAFAEEYFAQGTLGDDARDRLAGYFRRHWPGG